MDKEIVSIKKNDTWKLISKIIIKKTEVNRCQVDLQKKNAKEEMEGYKERLVKKGYSKKHEIDYDKVLDLVVRSKPIRLIIVTTTQYNWKI